MFWAVGSPNKLGESLKAISSPWLCVESHGSSAACVPLPQIAFPPCFHLKKARGETNNMHLQPHACAASPATEQFLPFFSREKALQNCSWCYFLDGLVNDVTNRMRPLDSSELYLSFHQTKKLPWPLPAFDQQRLEL